MRAESAPEANFFIPFACRISQFPQNTTRNISDHHPSAQGWTSCSLVWSSSTDHHGTHSHGLSEITSQTVSYPYAEHPTTVPSPSHLNTQSLPKPKWQAVNLQQQNGKRKRKSITLTITMFLPISFCWAAFIICVLRMSTSSFRTSNSSLADFS